MIQYDNSAAQMAMLQQQQAQVSRLNSRLRKQFAQQQAYKNNANQNQN